MIKHAISLSAAIEMTARFRKTLPDGFAKSEGFELESVNRLLQTKHAAFLKVYYGRKVDGTAHAILAVADAAGNDLLPHDLKIHGGLLGEEDDSPVLLQDGFRCPHWCPEDSLLDP